MHSATVSHQLRGELKSGLSVRCMDGSCMDAMSRTSSGSAFDIPDGSGSCISMTTPGGRLVFSAGGGENGVGLPLSLAHDRRRRRLLSSSIRVYVLDRMSSSSSSSSYAPASIVPTVGCRCKRTSLGGVVGRRRRRHRGGGAPTAMATTKAPPSLSPPSPTQPPSSPSPFLSLPLLVDCCLCSPPSLSPALS